MYLWLLPWFLLVAISSCVSSSPDCPQPLSYQPVSTPTYLIAHLGSANGDPEKFHAIQKEFEARNPGYRIHFRKPFINTEADPQDRAYFIQEGESEVSITQADGNVLTSEVGIGDLLLLRRQETARARNALAALEFTLPDSLPEDLPAYIRPDWDPSITDTPGGCATETGAYRRILLTWLRKNGPYNYHGLNAHRVRITDSFSHYHPVATGFDEFYLVQMVQENARILTSNQVAQIEAESFADREAAHAAIDSQNLQVGDLVYLPRGLMHRGLGGVLAQVITVPGFRPQAEIGVDHHLRNINAKLGLTGEEALPLHEAASQEPVVR